MTTAADIIALALKDAGILGVGQTALADDTADALTRLNMMISQWARKRWLVYHLKDVALTSTGAQSYTIGAGGAFNVARPDRLEAAFVRQLIPTGPNQVDFPLRLIEAREDYNRIALKSLVTWPDAVFYDADYPLGKVYVWPVPQATIFELHLTIKEPLVRFAGTSDAVALPPEYEAALHWNLVRMLRVAYQMAPDPDVNALARDALNVIRLSNAQVPTLSMPFGAKRRGGRYNVFSDR